MLCAQAGGLDDPKSPFEVAPGTPSAIPVLSSPSPSVGIISRIGSRMKYACFRVDDDHGHFAHRPGTTHSQLMPLGNQCLLHFLAYAGLDAEVTGVHCVREGRRRETARRPARGFDRLLNVHTEVHHVQKRLNCAHELIVSAWTSHQPVRLALLHDERGCQCAAWAFAWGEGVGLPRN